MMGRVGSWHGAVAMVPKACDRYTTTIRCDRMLETMFECNLYRQHAEFERIRKAPDNFDSFIP